MGGRVPVAAGVWKITMAWVVVCGALAGCSPAAPELETDAARQFQARVLSITQAAAANDDATALKSLDDLIAQLDAATADGKVSFKRHQSIQSAIDAVRADLTAQAQAKAKAQADQAAAAAAKAAADAAAAAAASQAATAPDVQAPAVPAPGNAGPGKSDKGKGKG